MDRRLAYKNLKTGFVVTILILLVFSLTFVAAFIYIS